MVVEIKNNFGNKIQIMQIKKLKLQDDNVNPVLFNWCEINANKDASIQFFGVDSKGDSVSVNVYGYKP